MGKGSRDSSRLARDRSNALASSRDGSLGEESPAVSLELKIPEDLHSSAPAEWVLDIPDSSREVLRCVAIGAVQLEAERAICYFVAVNGDSNFPVSACVLLENFFQ